MKVFVQIPCLNEENTIALVIRSIPKSIPGVDKIEILLIDDGSTDDTIKIAKRLGVKHFVYHTRNQGLARSFHDGVLYALKEGADIVVTTDGDNQYPQADIPILIQPIINKDADIVVADRQTHTIKHFSPLKKRLQKIGSKIVNFAANTQLPDAASGFRAYSRSSLIQINTVTRFSYCMETIIQAGNKRLAITSVPIKTNPKTRESRLFRSDAEHICKSGSAIIRAYVMYQPLVFFTAMGSILLVLGLIPFIRFLYYFLLNMHRHITIHHAQSLIGGSVLLITAMVLFALAIIADLIRINRIINEDNLEITKRIYLSQNK